MGFHNTARDESVFPWNSTGNIMNSHLPKKLYVFKVGKFRF